jgi:hypothetical protein
MQRNALHLLTGGVAVESVATRLQETGHQIVKHSDAFVARTRDAGATFLGETREASVQLYGAVRTEAKRWRRFATQRATALQTGLRNGLSLPAVERAVLAQVDGTLQAIDARVRARLAELERKPKTGKKSANGKSAGTRARKSKPSLPSIAA